MRACDAYRFAAASTRFVSGACAVAGNIERHGAGFGLVRYIDGLHLQRHRSRHRAGRGFGLGGRMNELSRPRRRRCHRLPAPAVPAIQHSTGAARRQHSARGGAVRRRDAERVAGRSSRSRKRPIVRHGPHGARTAVRVREQRIARFVQDFDAAFRRQRVGPHEHRLFRFARQRFQLRLIVLQKGRAARRDHHHDAVDQRRLGRRAARIPHSRVCARLAP